MTDPSAAEVIRSYSRTLRYIAVVTTLILLLLIAERLF